MNLYLLAFSMGPCVLFSLISRFHVDNYRTKKTENQNMVDPLVNYAFLKLICHLMYERNECNMIII